MGNSCMGDKIQQIQEEQDIQVQDDDGYDDYAFFKLDQPEGEIAYNLDDLPKEEMEEMKLAKLQQKIKNMQTHEKKGIKKLKLTRQRPKGQNKQHPYYIRSMDAIYIGQWVQSRQMYMVVPGGVGRLYKEDQIQEGQFKTIFESDQGMVFARQNLADLLIRENMKRAKFFGKENLQAKTLSATAETRKVKVLLDGEGRIFSRVRELSGIFRDGKLNGKGSMKLKNQRETYQYIGQFFQGKKEGKGLQKFKNNVYDGDFRHDLKHGKGTLTLFINNKLEEQEKAEAKMIEQDNKGRDPAELGKIIIKFVEERKKLLDEQLSEALKQYKWKQPERYKGKTFIDDEDFILEHIRRNKYIEYYKGEFKENLFDGLGKYVWFNGKTYQGTWKQGKMSGVGQFYWHTEGYYYYGQYENDKKHGKGTIIWSFAKRYRGSWAFGLRHGYGELISIEPLEKDKIVKKKEPENTEQPSKFANFFSIAATNLKEMALPKEYKSKLVIIGARFNRDKLQHKYFQKESKLYLDINELKKKYRMMNAKVRGVRCDYDEEQIDPSNQQVPKQ